MKKTVYSFIFLSCLIMLGCTESQKQIGEMQFPEGTVQHVVRADDIQWQDCPPNLPGGCEMAVLEGNPKSNELFTVRFKTNKDFIMPAHSHPKHERVTIIQGKAYVGFGEGVAKENAKAFEVGDYYVNKKGAVHTVWGDSSTIFQITGIGPWEAHFIEK